MSAINSFLFIEFRIDFRLPDWAHFSLSSFVLASPGTDIVRVVSCCAIHQVRCALSLSQVIELIEFNEAAFSTCLVNLVFTTPTTQACNTHIHLVRISRKSLLETRRKINVSNCRWMCWNHKLLSHVSSERKWAHTFTIHSSDLFFFVLLLTYLLALTVVQHPIREKANIFYLQLIKWILSFI